MPKPSAISPRGWRRSRRAGSVSGIPSAREVIEAHGADGAKRPSRVAKPDPGLCGEGPNRSDRNLVGQLGPRIEPRWQGEEQLVVLSAAQGECEPIIVPERLQPGREGQGR